MNINKILKQNNLKKIKTIKKRKNKIVLLVLKKEQKLIIKITDDKQLFPRFINEIKANNFVNKIKPKKLNLIMPKGKTIKTKHYCINIYKYINADDFANQDTLKIKCLPNSQILENLFQIVYFYDNIKQNEVPTYFINQNKKVFNEKMIFKTINKRCIKAINKKIITKQQHKKLIDNFKNIKYKKRFLHHDFVLWNMKNDNDDNIVLLDSEFSRYGMRYYDIAYYFIQTYIYFKNPKLAIKHLKYFIDKFKQLNKKSNIEIDIFKPLLYRITANLIECTDNKNMALLSKKLLKNILTNKIQSLYN